MLGGTADVWEGGPGKENDALSMAVKGAGKTELAI